MTEKSVQCECGRWVQPFRLVDTSTFPSEVTRGQRWACDVCWTGWIRHDPRHQRTINGRPFRMLDWLKLRGVPAANIARQKQNDAKLKAKLMSHKGQIERMADDDKRTSELARIDDIIHRRVG